MITYYFRTLKDEAIKEIPDPRSGVWVHVVEPTNDEFERLVNAFGLDVDILADAQDLFEVPRMERSGGATYCFTRYPFDDPEEDIDTAPLLIVMGETFVLTVTQREVPQFRSFFSGKTDVHTTQKAKLFIQIMSVVTASYERELVRLRRAVHRDRARLRRIGNKEIARFVNYEHKLNDMIAAVVPTNAWLQQVTNGNYMQLYNEDVDLMQDLMIANTQVVDSARSVLKTIQNVRNSAEAILTNNLNATIQTLTVFTILLTIPTLIASLYGMNVPLPFQDNPFGFWMVLGFIVVVLSGVLWQFKRNEWL